MQLSHISGGFRYRIGVKQVRAAPHFSPESLGEGGVGVNQVRADSPTGVLYDCSNCGRADYREEVSLDSGLLLIATGYPSLVF